MLKVQNCAEILRFYLITISLWLVITPSLSQDEFSNENDLKKQANILFDEHNYKKAYPLFSQLLSLYPKEAQYNYKFGTCLLYSSNDKGKAIPYIEYAAKRQTQDVDKEVFFYLGKAYHLNYRFADAIKAYTTYKGMASSKSIAQFDVERQIEMCENGKRLLRKITDLYVLEKKEVPQSDFFRSYNLTEYNAKIIVKPDELKTNFDKKQKEQNILYFSADRNQIYYSSYGDDGKNGRDIYFVTRISDGTLTAPTRLGETINTKYDEDYPFLHPNGKILYFSSKGHNSMGGYDIFKSEWNDNSQTWGKPVNMDFAISTPDDDILFVSDAEDKSAYFSSSRESIEGNISVYKIKLDRKPLDIAIIKGRLLSNTGDGIGKATITVTKISKDEVVGIFNTNADGSYTLNVPNGGKFMFSVESEGFKKSSELVIIPTQQEIKTLKQEIALINENSQNKVIIKNEFDAQIDSADMELAIQYIKKKALLEVSAAEEETTAVAEENTAASTEIKTETQNNNPVTNTDIIEMAYQDAKETQKDANELRRSSDAAQLLSVQKNDLSVQKYNEAKILMQSAEKTTNQAEKMEQLDKSASLRKESEILSKETALLLTLSNQMDDQAKAKQQQADAELKYAKDLDNALKGNASEKKINELLAQKEALDKKSESLKTSAAISSELNKQAENKQIEAGKSMAKYLDIQQDLEDLESEAKRLRMEAEKTKNDEVKQNLIQQAEEMEKEAEVKKQEATSYNTTAKIQQSTADSLKNNASLTSSVMKQIQSSAEALSTFPEGTHSTNTTPSTNETQPTTTTSSSTTQSQNTLANPGSSSAYVSVFIKQTEDADKMKKEVDKEAAKAIIYQAWTDTLDKQIAELKKRLTLTKEGENKKQIQNKIYELESSVEDKRQRAAESRNKVDHLKLQEALAAASTISTDSSVITPDATVVMQQTTAPVTEGAAAKDINEEYESKLKENEKITSEYEKKEKEQELYQEWSAALYNESQRLASKGKSKEADNVLNESKAKQQLANKSAENLIEIKTQQTELAVNTDTGSISAETPLTTNPTSIQTTTPSANSQTATSETSIKEPTQLEQPELIITKNESIPPEPSVSTNPVTTGTTIPPSNNAITASEPINQSIPITSSDQGKSEVFISVPESVKNKEEYTHFVSLQNEADLSRKRADRENILATDIQKIADEQFKESQKISEQIANESDPVKMQQLKDKSDNLDIRVLKNQAKADSIRSIAQNSEAEANSKRIESELFLQSLDKAVYEEINAATGTKANTGTITPAENNTIPIPSPTIQPIKTSTTTPIPSSSTKTESTNPATINSAGTNTKFDIISIYNPVSSGNTLSSGANNSPTVSSEILKYYGKLLDKLEIISGSPYSSSKPIPIDPPMPEGLVYKVQIGAFRNSIPQDLFKGIMPITAETTPQGLKRYTAGLFQNLTTATKAKNQVNNLGYRDAFIVAFLNGKRVSITTGMGSLAETLNTVAENLEINETKKSAIEVVTSVSSPQPTKNAVIAKAIDVKTVSGLFYTVQIGVFSRPVTSIQLYHISPLNSEKTDNGFIRYTTGRFDDATKAGNAKNSIAQKGITDAFVVAYFNGNRISLAAAKTIVDSQGKEALSKNQEEYTPSTSSDILSSSSVEKPKNTSALNIIFRVQIGAFRGEVPIEVANKMLAVSEKGIENFRENDMKIYVAGKFSTYEPANILKTELVSKGFRDAFVIALKDGKKISAKEAIELLKNR